MQDEEMKGTIQEAEEKIEKVADELEIRLPHKAIAFSIKIIVLLMLVGGLSILGSTFTDFVVPNSGGLFIHLFRMITGVVFLVIGYGIYKQERWAVWLYGAIVFIGLVINFAFAIVPTLLVWYLYTQRAIFKPCFIDEWIEKNLKKSN